MAQSSLCNCQQTAYLCTVISPEDRKERWLSFPVSNWLPVSKLTENRNIPVELCVMVAIWLKYALCPTPHILLVASNRKEKGVDFQNKHFTTDCCLFPELDFPLEGHLELLCLCRSNTGENHWVDTTCFYLKVTVSEQFCLIQLLPALTWQCTPSSCWLCHSGLWRWLQPSRSWQAPWRGHCQ